MASSNQELQQLTTMEDDEDEVSYTQKDSRNDIELDETVEMEIDEDPMHVDVNDEQWVKCIPKLSLTGATILAAIIGAAIGLTIALTGPQTETQEVFKVTYNHTITLSEVEAGNVSIKNVYETQIINGEPVYFYYINESNGTTEVPVEQLNEDWKAVLEFPGKIWINALQLLVLPLIVLMMIILPSRVDQVGFIGKVAVPLYIFTSTMAAIQGTILVWVIRPGEFGSSSTVTDPNAADLENLAKVTELEAFLGIFYQAVPQNIITAMADLSILGLIVFFIIVGVLLRRPNVKIVERDAIINASKGILRCCMAAIVWVIWFAPFGMMSLICVKIAETENLVSLLASLGMYLVTLILGQCCHLFGFYPLLMFATIKSNAWKFFTKIYEAPLLAFATSSSAATLPRSLQVADKAGVRKSVYQFILPLGAAINMDGTALSWPVGIGLIAQLNGIELSMATIVTIIVLSVVLSVGAAPIPSAGIVYLTMLFKAAGMEQYMTEGIATLYILDWLNDRIQTSVNVSSDLYVAKMIDGISIKLEKNKHKKVICGCCICGTDEKQNNEDLGGGSLNGFENETTTL